MEGAIIEIILILISFILSVAAFIFQIIVTLLINMLLLDFVAIAGTSFWLLHFGCSLSIIVSLLLCILIALIGIFLTRVPFLGHILTTFYGFVVAYVFYLIVDDSWTCNDPKTKLIVEMIGCVVVFAWHFYSSRHYGYKFLTPIIGSILDKFGYSKILDKYLGFYEFDSEIEDDESSEHYDSVEYEPEYAAEADSKNDGVEI